MKTLIFIALLISSLHAQNSPRELASSISYANHGNDWGDACGAGGNQSPIDIDTVVGTCDNSMVFDISFIPSTMNVTLFDTGYTLQSNDSVSKLYATDINGYLSGYSAVDFVFHAPSEHTIEGTSFDLELQIQHALNDEFSAATPARQPIAIVSIFFNADDSASLHPFISALNMGSLGTTAQINMQTVLGSLLPTPNPYFTYQGSTTIPSCTQGVNWYIIQTPQLITPGQLTQFTSRYAGSGSFAGGNGNNRAIQSTNDRTIKKGGTDCEDQFVYFFSFFILYIFINYFIFKLL